MQNKEFVITSGEKFIRQDIRGKYVQVGNLSLADTYPTKEGANKIIRNSIPRSLSRCLYVAEIVNGEVIQCSTPFLVKPVVRKSNQGYRYEDGAVDKKWISKFEGLYEMFDEAAGQEKDLLKRIAETEAGIVDIEHYIEFTPLNASDGYRIYKKLSELLRYRRVLKNEHKIVSAVCENLSAKLPIQKIADAITACSNSEYKPRIFVELFENGVSAIDRSDVV